MAQLDDVKELILVPLWAAEWGEAAQEDVEDNARGPHVHLQPITCAVEAETHYLTTLAAISVSRGLKSTRSANQTTLCIHLNISTESVCSKFNSPHPHLPKELTFPTPCVSWCEPYHLTSQSSRRLFAFIPLLSSSVMPPLKCL